MKTFFATFGQNHANRNCFVEIVAEDHHVARLYMISTYLDQWLQQSMSENREVTNGRRRLTKVFQAAGKELHFTTGRRGNAH